MLGEIVGFSLVSLSAVLVVVDPLAAVPFFLAMTSEDGPERRRDIARRASVAAFLVLAGFAMVGALLFRALGIFLPLIMMLLPVHPEKGRPHRFQVEIRRSLLHHEPKKVVDVHRVAGLELRKFPVRRQVFASAGGT